MLACVFTVFDKIKTPVASLIFITQNLNVMMSLNRLNIPIYIYKRINLTVIYIINIFT